MSCLNPATHRHPCNPLPAWEVEFTGQSWHPLELSRLYVPSEQLAHALAPLIPLNFPGRQALHAASPSPVRYVPARQGVHWLALPVEYPPAVQFWQSPVPPVEKRPAPHTLHSQDPVVSTKEPAAQAVQAELPSLLSNVPA